MLSLIVCSINPAYLEGLQKSVSDTIGVEHEWLIWDNRETNTGLCEIYNRMAEKAKFPLLCFLHEDLIFQTDNWGKYLNQVFSDPGIGMLGIAGSSYKSQYLSGWYSGGGARDYSHIIHRENETDFTLSFPLNWGELEPQVVCIDGVFMVCRRDLWMTTKFNETLLKGFHFYDIDFSLRVSLKSRVVVTNRINMVHLTVGGDFGDRWVKQAFIYHQDAKNMLPVKLDTTDTKNADIAVARYWLDWLKNQPISFANRFAWVWKQNLFILPLLWYSIAKFFLYRPLGLKYIHQIFKKAK